MQNIFKKIEYNSPVILTFSLLSTLVFILDQVLPIELMNSLFVYRGEASLLGFVKMFLCPMGHGSVEHLLGNITIILLIGPMLEEKLSSKVLLILMFITSLLIGLFHLFVFSGGILGASGIVFMLIILTSFTNVKEGKIPLTFIVICILFLGKEIYNGIFVNNNVSELAHLLGAGVGMGYYFIKNRIIK